MSAAKSEFSIKRRHTYDEKGVAAAGSLGGSSRPPADIKGTKVPCAQICVSGYLI